jgi:hypothetical protein
MIPSRYKLSLPIPVDCISLSDARKAMMRVAIPHLCKRHWWEQEEELAQEWRDRILRSALVDSELVGLITGLNDESRKLRASEWALPAKFVNTPDGHIVDHGDNPGFLDDYVAPCEPYRHGPDTTFVMGKHRPVFVVRADFDRWLNSNWPHDVQPKIRQKRGRKPHDWKSIEEAVIDLMGHHGEFSPVDPEWDCQERLLERLQEKSGISRTSLAEHVPAMVHRWLVQKYGN